MISRLSVAATLAAVAVATLAGPAAAESPNMNTPAKITGSAVVGSQLTAHNGTWLYLDGRSCGSECVMTYQWQRCKQGCTDIAGATGRFYTVHAEDAGHSLRVMETMTSRDCGEINYSTGTQECRDVSKSAPSAPTAVVPGGAAPTSPAAPPVPSAPKPQAPLAPTPTAAPEISGVAMVEETLTATRGLWTGTQPLAVALEWQRCDATGASCEGLGIGADTYTVLSVDVGRTLRVKVTSSNAAGSRTVLSDPTPVVSELKPTAEKPSIAAARVTAPHRLVVDRLVVSPARFKSRGRLTVSVRVVDTRGFLVEGALVTAAALPATAVRLPAAATTGADGTATLVFAPGQRLKVRVKSLVIVLTARRPGDKVTSPRAAVVRTRVAVRR